MKKLIIFLVLLSVLLISACNNSDELSGQSFDVANTPVLQEDLDSPNKYHSIMTLEFLEGTVTTNAIHDGDGTYELADDVLAIMFENENESLEITFTVKESDKDFSEYSALISDVDFKITDADKISHLKNLALKLTKDIPVEFLKK